MNKANRQTMQRERQKRIRAKGRRHFVLWHGVLGWGLPTAVLYALGMTWWSEGRGFLFWLPIAVVLFPVGGYFWGAWMWRWMEKQWESQDPGDPV